jgi:hypothetical protein
MCFLVELKRKRKRKSEETKSQKVISSAAKEKPCNARLCDIYQVKN